MTYKDLAHLMQEFIESRPDGIEFRDTYFHSPRDVAELSLYSFAKFLKEKGKPIVFPPASGNLAEPGWSE